MSRYNHIAEGLPDFIVVGAEQAGGQWIKNFLEEHPDVYLPSRNLGYFVYTERDNGYHPNQKEDGLVRDLGDYKFAYSHAQPNHLRGEYAPLYMYDWMSAIRNIKQAYGANYRMVKIIIALRNPVHRALAHYQDQVEQGIEDLPLSEALYPDTIITRLNNYDSDFFDYLGFSFYADAITAYRNTFENVHFFWYDEMIEDEERVFRSLCQFLRLDSEAIQLRKRISQSMAAEVKPNPFTSFFGNRPKPLFDGVWIKEKNIPPISEEFSHKLYGTFIEDVERVKHTLLKNVDHWKGPYLS